MALRAGYYGIKRAFRDKLEQIIPGSASEDNVLATASDIKKVYGVIGKTGAINLLKNTGYTRTVYDVTYTVNDDLTVTANGKNTDPDHQSTFPVITEAISFPFDVIMSGCPEGGNTSTTYRMYANLNGSTKSDIGNGTLIPANTSFRVLCEVWRGYEAVNLVFKPMVRPADVTDPAYVKWCMTNQELTAAISTINSTLGDHKTEINAIISAATGAADFAAFKTAMEALTPLTRSADPAEDTRSLEIEETSEEEPVVTKKRTTKKSTKTEEV